MTEKTITAEVLALQKYPVNEYVFNNGFIQEKVDLNEKTRRAFTEGFELAECKYQEYLSKVKKECYTKTKTDILSRLPKWKKADRDIFSNTVDYITTFRHDGGDYADYEEIIVTNRILKDEYYLDITQLDILMKEEENEN